MGGFFHTLIKPDHDDDPEQGVIAEAANILQIGEFQLLQLAYRAWHHQDLPEDQVAKLFTSYMLEHKVPHWARHYARHILERYERGEIDDNAPVFHRYDHDYHTTVPRGVQRFCVAVAGVIVAVFGSIYVANQVIESPVSLLPPYFEERELPQTPPDMTVKTRSKEHFISPGGAGNFSDVTRGDR